MRLPLLLPTLLSLAALVLSLLLLFAGSSPSFLPETHIILLNTTSLGHNLIPTRTTPDEPTSTKDCSRFGDGLRFRICSGATSLAASAGDTIDEWGDDVADEIRDKLGISEFYALHVMDACEGDFGVNGTGGYNVTNCTGRMEMAGYNVTRLFDHELGVGELKVNLADLGFTRELIEEMDKIPKVLLALGVIFIVAGGLTGLSFLGSVVALFLVPRHRRSKALVVLNLVLALLAFGVSLAGSLITTVGARPAAKKIDGFGEDIGLRATVGTKFMALTWAATGAMFGAVVYWVWEMVQARKRSMRSRGRFGEKGDMRYVDGPEYRSQPGYSQQAGRGY